MLDMTWERICVTECERECEDPDTYLSGGRGEEMVGLAENALYHQDFDMCLSLSGGLYMTWVKNGGTRTANAHGNRG